MSNATCVLQLVHFDGLIDQFTITGEDLFVQAKAKLNTVLSVVSAELGFIETNGDYSHWLDDELMHDYIPF